MRIAVVVRSLKIGGMERVAVNLAEAFSDNGHEAHLIYFKDKDKALLAKEDVYTHHYNLEKSLKKTIIGFLLHIFSKIFNLIFRKTYFFWQGLFLAPIFKYKLHQTEKKYGKFDLIILRGHGTIEFIWPLKDKRIVQMIESVFIAHGSFMMNFYLKCIYTNKNLACVSSGVKERLELAIKIANVKPKSIHIINNPLNIKNIEILANEYKPSLKEVYIVSVTRLDINKNISFLIDSYAYARKFLNLKHKLVIVGDGNQKENIITQVKSLNIEEFVIFTGLLKNPYPWIKNAKLLTMTSISEGLGMVLLEALALHTKIISTDAEGGIRDIMKGELSENVSPFNTKKYAQIMMSILESKNNLNTNNFLTPYTPKIIVEEYIKKYL